MIEDIVQNALLIRRNTSYKVCKGTQDINAKLVIKQTAVLSKLADF